jgi:TonB family protein
VFPRREDLCSHIKKSNSTTFNHKYINYDHRKRRMNSFIAVTTLIALSLFVKPIQSWEKRAVSNTQRTLASDLDAELPKLPFTDWLAKVVGPGAGVVWQLGECGERVDTAPSRGVDAQACVQVNTVLSDGRKVIVMIAVGTFKKGVTGPPAFHFGVIDQKGDLRPILRLRDLQKLLSGPGKPANRPAAKLPEVSMPPIILAADSAYSTGTPLLAGDDFSQLTPIEDPAPPPEPPPNRPQSSSRSLKPQSIQQVVDKVLEGNAITRVEPTYPPTARVMRAFGMVRVQITISETGSVIDAKAISGHQALRPAAVDAAYKWVFKPTTVNGEPIKVQGVLTFNFRSSP